jgi:hypothetical protein
MGCVERPSECDRTINGSNCLLQRLLERPGQGKNANGQNSSGSNCGARGSCRRGDPACLSRRRIHLWSSFAYRRSPFGHLKTGRRSGCEEHRARARLSCSCAESRCHEGRQLSATRRQTFLGFAARLAYSETTLTHLTVRMRALAKIVMKMRTK